jgi:colanic acid/amylovoran biosynthesis protein
MAPAQNLGRANKLNHLLESTSMTDKNKPLKFGLMGAALDTGNMGVSALSASVIQLMTKLFPAACVTLFIGNRSSAPQQLATPDGLRPVPVVNFRYSPRARLAEQLWFIFLLAIIYRLVPVGFVRSSIARNNRWISKLLTMDLIGDIQGGDSFSDIYGLRRFLLGSIPLITALLVGKRVIMLPQTYGPYKSLISRAITRYILKRCNLILARDRQSLSLAGQLINSSRPLQEMQFCPDVAFTLPPIEPRHIDIDPPLPDRAQEILVGVNINGLMYSGGYTGRNMFDLKMDYRVFASKLITDLLQHDHLRVLLVPHTFGFSGSVNSDPEASRSVIAAVNSKQSTDKLHMVMKPYNQSEMKAIIGKCDFFVGSRMHACIAALSQGIPTVAVAYSKKFKGVFASVGAEESVMDARTSTADEAVHKILDDLTASTEGKQGLENKMDKVRQQIETTFNSLF